MSNKVELWPYQPVWREIFIKWSKLIKAAWPDNCLEFYHIGSTAVEGLMAKPIVDIMPVIRDIRRVDVAKEALSNLGLIYRGEMGILFRRYFRDEKNTVHIHVWEEGQGAIEQFLLFRDYIRTHEEEKQKYQELKQELAQKYSADRPSYTAAKDEFINDIIAKTGFNGIIINQVQKQREKDKYNEILNANMFEVVTDQEFNDLKSDTMHVIMTKGIEIVAIAKMVKCLQDIKISYVLSQIPDSGFDLVMKQKLDLWILQKRPLNS